MDATAEAPPIGAILVALGLALAATPAASSALPPGTRPVDDRLSGQPSSSGPALPALPAPQATVGHTVFEETFDDGTADGWSRSGLWRVTACRSASPDRSLGYNQGTCPPDYDVGTTSGSAVSPSIVLATGSTYTLRWSSWYETETGTDYDRKLVELSVDDGPWQELVQESGTQTSWHTHEADLTDHAGHTVRIRFHFDSIDHAYNDMEGWYVDDVAVVESADATPPTIDSLDSSSHPDPGTWYGDRDASFEWTASDEGGSGVAGASYVFGEDAGDPDCVVDTSASEVTVTGDAFGVHAFRVRAVDGAGNCGDVVERTVRIDDVPPTIADREPGDGDVTGDPFQTITVTYHDEDGGADVDESATAVDASRLELLVDGTDRTDEATFDGHQLEYTPDDRWSHGDHTVTIRLHDTAEGANRRESTWTFTYRASANLGGDSHKLVHTGVDLCEHQNDYFEADGSCAGGAYRHAVADDLASFFDHEVVP